MPNPLPDQMMTCPYNMAHQVEHYRMHIHLQKCRKQHANCNKKSCPFDSTHIINDVELDYHISVCPKRIMLDSQIYVMDDDSRPPVEVVHNLTTHTINFEESWDDEVSTSYKPDPSKKAAHVIQKVQGATPSERRKVRENGIKTYKAPQAE